MFKQKLVHLSRNLHIHYVRLGRNLYVHYVRLRPFVEFLAIYHLCHSPSSCGESVLQPGGGGRDAAPAPEAPLHPRPHHGPRRLRHHVLPGDH